MNVVPDTTTRKPSVAENESIDEQPGSVGTSPVRLRAVASASESPPPFSVRLRGRLQRDAEGQSVTGSDAHEVFARILQFDVSAIDEPILKWRDAERVIALDFDRPDDAPPLTDLDAESVVTRSAPSPAYVWTTHGGGLRVIFVSQEGVSALALAGVWLMFAPLGQLAGWRLEVKTDTRHPKGLRDGVSCGMIHEFEPTTDFSKFGDESAATEDAVTAFLEARGLTKGRHGTEACLWGCGPSSGNPPVNISDQGVRCFRCNRFASWEQLVGDADSTQHELFRAARALVHVAHQGHVIAARRPIMPDLLVEPGWGHLLTVVNADRLASPDAEESARWQARVKQASSRLLDIARTSSGGWVDANTLAPRKVTAERTLKHLPSCYWPPLVDKADGPGLLDGFVPIHPIGAGEVLAPGVLPPMGSVFVRRPRAENAPPAPNITARPTAADLEIAWEAIDTMLPGVCRGYHFAIIVAMLIGQHAVGTPPVIFATGQSGSAKTGQLHLAAGALGSKAAPIVLGTTDDTSRRAGLALEDGAGILFADEVGRVDSVFTKLEPILSANSVLVFRAKYANERRVPMRCALCFLGSTLPYAIVRSPELARRGVGYRLTGADKQWALIDPVTEQKLDLSEARRIPPLRDALDTITAFAWWAVHDLGPAGDWRRLLLEHHDAVDLPKLDLVDDDGSARNAAIVDLYEAYRSAKPSDLSSMPGWTGWLIADQGTKAGTQLNVLVELDAEKARFTAETSDLERLNLAPILGFSQPQLQLVVHRRSRRILVKFVEVGVMRGQGRPRNALPPAMPSKSPSQPKY